MEEPWNGRRNRRGGAGIVVGRKRKRPSLTGEKKKTLTTSDGLDGLACHGLIH